MSDEPDWIDELYAEGAKELPPPALDEKIRAAARAPVQHPWYRSPGRLAALATAASMVIAVSVIYFEPEQSRLDAPPIQELAPKSLESVDAEIEFEESAPGSLAEGERVGATEGAASTATADEIVERRLKQEAAEQKSMLAQKISNTPAEAPAAVSAEPAPPAKTASRTAPDTFADRQPEDPSSTNLRALELDRAESQIEEAIATGAADQALLADPAAALMQACGPLPGTDETREILSDEAGWRVVVTVGDDVRTWRCIDGAWIEKRSEEQ